MNNQIEKMIETEEIKNGNYIKENYDKMNKYGGISMVYITLAVCFAVPMLKV